MALGHWLCAQLRIRCEVGVQWYRNEMDARSDVFAAQSADELITVDGETIEVQPQGIEVPGMPDIPVRLRDVKFRHRGESLVVKLGDGCAPRGERFEFSAAGVFQSPIGYRSGCI